MRRGISSSIHAAVEPPPCNQASAMQYHLPGQPDSGANFSVTPATETEATPDAEPQDEANPPGSIQTKWLRWGVVIAGVVAVILILGSLIFYIKLDDIRESNAATTKAVLNFTMLDERAWMEPVGIDAPLAVGSPISISTKAINRGKTLANTCVLFLCMQELKSSALPDVSVMDSGTDSQFGASMVIAPGQQIAFASVTAPEPLTKDLFNSIQSGQIRIFILGKMRYDDIFKKRHWFKFCYVFDPKSSQWIAFGNIATDNQ